MFAEYTVLNIVCEISFSVASFQVVSDSKLRKKYLLQRQILRKESKIFL